MFLSLRLALFRFVQIEDAEDAFAEFSVEKFSLYFVLNLSITQHICLHLFSSQV